MKVLKKRMSRRDFLKYSFSTAALLGLASLKIPGITDDKTNLKGYGAGGYGK